MNDNHPKTANLESRAASAERTDNGASLVINKPLLRVVLPPALLALLLGVNTILFLALSTQSDRNRAERETLEQSLTSMQRLHTKAVTESETVTALCELIEQPDKRQIADHANSYLFLPAQAQELLSLRCPQAHELVSNFNAHSDLVYEAVWKGSWCEHAPDINRVIVSGTFVNPLSFPIDVQITGHIRAGKALMASGTITQFAIESNEQRPWLIYLESKDLEMKNCIIHEVNWWPTQ